ncbi:MAG: cytochrome c biogenesis protein ResB [Candidatus Hatepunaea meridiana]|nr:cytochrome c biogenesis protein ResB [Candidatus Hatepunaea meridiana]
MKFAIWILVLTAVLSLFSLIIGEFLPTGTSQTLFVALFELNNPFRAWWFRLLLGILSISLTVCIVQRTPTLIRQAFGIPVFFNQNVLRSFKSYRRTNQPDGEVWASRLFNRLGLSYHRIEKGGYTALSGKSGGLSRLAPLLLHSGLLLLLIGGLIIGISGYSLHVRGSAGNIITNPEWDFALRIDKFELFYHPLSINQWVELPDGLRGKVVRVQNDSARIELSGHSGKVHYHWFPKDSLENDFLISKGGELTPYQGNIRSYVTTATILVDDSALFEDRIEVNHPLRFNGYRFYQTSFETGGVNTDVDTIVVQVQSDHGTEIVKLTPEGDSVSLPWLNWSLKPGSFYPDFKLDQDMQPFSASGHLHNPAMRIKLFDDNKEVGERWVFKQVLGNMGGDDLPLSLHIVNLVGVTTRPADYITVLNVRKESGGWVIWAGFIFVTIGLFLGYGLNYRQAWVVIVKKPEGNDEIHLAIRCSNNDHGFRERFDSILTK